MSRIHTIVPRFILGNPADFVVIGKGFDNTGGSQFNVVLSSADSYSWVKNTQEFIDSTRVAVNGTPSDAGGGPGIGDLTIKVVNGDGVESNTQSLDVSYEPADS